MKLRLFESYQRSEVDFLGQISNGMLPNDAQSQAKFESFLKKVVLNTDMKLNKGFTFIPVNEQLQISTINKAEDYFPNCEVYTYNTFIKTDYAARIHYKFANETTPFFNIRVKKDQKIAIDFNICKGPFIFVTTYLTKYQSKERHWEIFRIPDSGGKRGLHPWDAWGFFNLDGFDQIFSEVSRKIQA